MPPVEDRPLEETVNYREIKDFIGYRIGDDGSVQSLWLRGGNIGEPHIGASWNTLKHILDEAGYHYVGLYQQGQVTRYSVSRLVLETFIGPCPEGKECRHLDGDKDNNNLDNLAWGTRKQNVQDRIKHDTQVRGSTHGQAKIDETKAKRIIERYTTEDITQRQLAEEEGISGPEISRLVNGVAWKHLGVEEVKGGKFKERRGAKGVKHHAAKLTPELAREIYVRWFAGEFMTKKQIALEYDVDPRTILNIINRVIWREATEDIALS